MTLNHEAYRRLQGEYLQFPAFLAAYSQMAKNLDLYRKTGVAENLLILGESGTGKTSLSKLFALHHPRQVLRERDRVPVLRVSIPPAATIAATAEALLDQLGDPAPTTGTISKKTQRVTKLCKGCGVEMLILDEAQHVNDRGRTATQYFVGDWLKSLMDELAIPVVMLGLQRTEGLLQVNDQLRRRFVHRLSLAVYVQGRDTGHEGCVQLFSSLASALEISLSPKPFSWEELASRLHFASDSRIAYVKQILLGAFHIAANEDFKIISVDILERAFTSSIWSAGVEALNPFNQDFQFRRLDRLGEPFQQADMANRVSVR